MDKAWIEELRVEAAGLGVALDEGQAQALASHVDLLLKWNPKVNLTRITEPTEVRIKHVVDSLGSLRVVPPGAASVLDLGAGAGFPGVPWLIARPDLQVTMVDSVGKKISFVKTVLGSLRLTRGRAVQARLEGHPEREGLQPTDLVVSRAFTALDEVLRLAPAYLKPGGSVVAMLGTREGEAEAREIVARAGYDLAALEHFDLPRGMGSRIVLRAVPRGTGRL